MPIRSAVHVEAACQAWFDANYDFATYQRHRVRASELAAALQRDFPLAWASRGWTNTVYDPHVILARVQEVGAFLREMARTINLPAYWLASWPARYWFGPPGEGNRAPTGGWVFFPSSPSTWGERVFRGTLIYDPLTDERHPRTSSDIAGLWRRMPDRTRYVQIDAMSVFAWPISPTTDARLDCTPSRYGQLCFENVTRSPAYPAVDLNAPGARPSPFLGAHYTLLYTERLLHVIAARPATEVLATTLREYVQWVRGATLASQVDWERRLLGAFGTGTGRVTGFARMDDATFQSGMDAALAAAALIGGPTVAAVVAVYKGLTMVLQAVTSGPGTMRAGRALVELPGRSVTTTLPEIATTEGNKAVSGMLPPLPYLSAPTGCELLQGPPPPPPPPKKKGKLGTVLLVTGAAVGAIGIGLALARR
jgi:hypothetical protein